MNAANPMGTSAGCSSARRIVIRTWNTASLLAIACRDGAPLRHHRTQMRFLGRVALGADVAPFQEVRGESQDITERDSVSGLPCRWYLLQSTLDAPLLAWWVLFGARCSPDRKVTLWRLPLDASGSWHGHVDGCCQCPLFRRGRRCGHCADACAPQAHDH